MPGLFSKKLHYIHISLTASVGVSDNWSFSLLGNSPEFKYELPYNTFFRVNNNFLYCDYIKDENYNAILDKNNNLIPASLWASKKLKSINIDTVKVVTDAPNNNLIFIKKNVQVNKPILTYNKKVADDTYIIKPGKVSFMGLQLKYGEFGSSNYMHIEIYLKNSIKHLTIPAPEKM